MTVQRIHPRGPADLTGPARGREQEEPRVIPGRHGLSREEVVASQRRRVLRATVEIIGGQGFAETPVADLVNHAGISRKTFYELFSGKEACVLAIYDDATTRLRTLVESAYERGVTPQERIDVVVDALFEWVSREPRLARLCLLEAPSSGPAGRKRMASTTTWLVGAVTDWLGDLDVPELLPELLVGGIHQMVVHRLITDAEELPTLATELTEVWLDLERWPASPVNAA